MRIQIKRSIFCVCIAGIFFVLSCGTMVYAKELPIETQVQEQKPKMILGLDQKVVQSQNVIAQKLDNQTDKTISTKAEVESEKKADTETELETDEVSTRTIKIFGVILVLFIFGIQFTIVTIKVLKVIRKK